MKMKNTNLQKGFTIIELLLYMGIFSILLVVLMSLFTSILSVHTESQATSSIDQDGTFALARLAYDIHRSSAITLPALGASGSTLTLTISGVNDTYSIKNIGGNNYLVFTDNTIPASPVDIKATSIGTSASVNFTVLGNDPLGTPAPACAPSNCKKTVKIALTLTSTTVRTGGVLQSQVFNTTVATR